MHLRISTALNVQASAFWLRLNSSTGAVLSEAHSDAVEWEDSAHKMYQFG